LETLSKNKIKWIRSLQRKKNRDIEQLFIVEGEKMVRELIEQHSEQIECVISTDTDFSFNGLSYHASKKSMEEISSLKTPNKLLAVVKIIKDKQIDAQFILALDDIQDPGNMGTILRIADWFGVDKIICSKNTVDIYNSKVVQASMGSIFRIPTEYCQLEDYLSKIELPIYGALLDGENIYTKTLERKGVIILGNEGSGISESVQEFIQEAINIPRFGQAESLNVAIAGSIILSEFSRR